MCGIAGHIGSCQIGQSIIGEHVIQAIRHRGPDGNGFVTIPSPSGCVFFAHTRLSIIDTSSNGAQPLSILGNDKTNKVTIIFNGEIYNYRELRDELVGLGYSFSGGTDTEVILVGYCAWGTSLFAKLRGMFAFALADPAKDLVFLVRDHLGIKPLYFLSSQQFGVSFSSEIRTFRFLPGSDRVRRISGDVLHGFFAQGMVLGQRPFVDGVEELAPGQCLAFDFSGKNKARIFLLANEEIQQTRWKNRDNAVGFIQNALKVSVVRHLIADVPVGIFLSAGIDSAALATIASESHPDLRTVSIGFDQSDTDESREASLIAGQLGIQNEVITLRSDSVLANLDSAFSAMDQPTVDGFNTFFVSRVARQAGLKVALSGLGGDELFGGYASFRDVPRANWISRFTRLAAIGKAISSIGKAFGSRSLWKVGRTGVYPPGFVGMYFLRRELFSPEDRLDLLGSPSGEIEPITGVPVDLFESLSNTISKLDAENSVSVLEQQVYMRNMLLRDSDVFSMANGLEIRVPFLDQDLIELVNPMPGIWKRPGPKPKALLVDAVGSRFPVGIQGKKKRGFSFPWKAWFRGPMREFVRERLDSNTWQKLQIPKSAVDKIWHRFELKDPTVTALHVLALVCLAELVERQQLSL